MNVRRSAVVLFAWSVVALSCAGTHSPGQRPTSFPLPDIKKDCSTCHVIQGEKTTAALTNDLSGLCLDCHPDRVAPQEHRIGITPPPAMKGLPLADGKMTCFTCHDPHKNPFGSLLRMPETRLCLACHPY